MQSFVELMSPCVPDELFQIDHIVYVNLKKRAHCRRISNDESAVSRPAERDGFLRQAKMIRAKFDAAEKSDAAGMK